MRVHLHAEEGEEQLRQLLDSLSLGRVELYQLTPALAGFYTLGFDQGRASRDGLIARLQARLDVVERERDVYYERLHNPGQKFSEMAQRRLDQAAELHAAEPDSGTAFIGILNTLAARTPTEVEAA